ncbi:hypothetical protein [Microbulbifer sp. JTAC008]|uniref:hypothetical protein n=1 Tax=unclassified Microbulbifer TaxID=2619833 RepID=UPI00403A7266
MPGPEIISNRSSSNSVTGANESQGNTARNPEGNQRDSSFSQVQANALSQANLAPIHNEDNRNEPPNGISHVPAIPYAKAISNKSITNQQKKVDGIKKVINERKEEANTKQSNIDQITKTINKLENEIKISEAAVEKLSGSRKEKDKEIAERYMEIIVDNKNELEEKKNELEDNKRFKLKHERFIIAAEKHLLSAENKLARMRSKTESLPIASEVKYSSGPFAQAIARDSDSVSQQEVNRSALENGGLDVSTGNEELVTSGETLEDHASTLHEFPIAPVLDFTASTLNENPEEQTILPQGEPSSSGEVPIETGTSVTQSQADREHADLIEQIQNLNVPAPTPNLREESVDERVPLSS